MSKITQLQTNTVKKILAKKMQKFVEAALKKLLNGYSVTPVYYRCTLHVLFQK